MILTEEETEKMPSEKIYEFYVQKQERCKQQAAANRQDPFYKKFHRQPYPGESDEGFMVPFFRPTENDNGFVPIEGNPFLELADRPCWLQATKKVGVFKLIGFRLGKTVKFYAGMRSSEHKVEDSYYAIFNYDHLRLFTRKEFFDRVVLYSSFDAFVEEFEKNFSPPKNDNKKDDEDDDTDAVKFGKGFYGFVEKIEIFFGRPFDNDIDIFKKLFIFYKRRFSRNVKAQDRLSFRFTKDHIFIKNFHNEEKTIRFEKTEQSRLIFLTMLMKKDFSTNGVLENAK